MAPAHLKPSCSAEIQASKIPATSLKRDGKFVEFENVSSANDPQAAATVIAGAQQPSVLRSLSKD